MYSSLSSNSVCNFQKHLGMKKKQLATSCHLSLICFKRLFLSFFFFFLKNMMKKKILSLWKAFFKFFFFFVTTFLSCWKKLSQKEIKCAFLTDKACACYKKKILILVKEEWSEVRYKRKEFSLAKSFCESKFLFRF